MSYVPKYCTRHDNPVKCVAATSPGSPRKTWICPVCTRRFGDAGPREKDDRELQVLGPEDVGTVEELFKEEKSS